MTTHPDHRPISSVTVRLDALGETIAAVPAMLGFVPHRSLLVLCLGTGGTQKLTVGTIMRHDLEVPERHEVSYGSLFVISDDMLEVIDRFAHQCQRENVHTVIAVVVDDRASATTSWPTCDPRYRALAQCVTDELGAHGVEVLRVLSIAEIAAGREWASLIGPEERGLVADPSLSPVTFAHALEGRVVLPSRAALEDALRPVNDDVSRELARLVPRARADRSGSDGFHLEQILQVIQCARAPSPDLPPAVELSVQSAARIGVALNRLMVRDSLLALVLTDVALIAEMLWSDLMRVLPAPDRAVPASLVAFSAYARGDGATAAVAIGVALKADPEYSLARLLDTSLAAGAGPEMIREVAFSGYAVAELCGVRLPLPHPAS
ncbi:DUF4192 domain-containing protein [Rhodococcoides yunnanense]|uniref:DUF4192 domain-containing protein n=1 Tax=Rhodococcoides yunnanense TaxID=278209 RepID=UPI000933D3C0|nr:DUF4192 domain-containing protein [Rhodococcus yunnanensis]